MTTDWKAIQMPRNLCNNINDDWHEEIDESDAEDAPDYYVDAGWRHREMMPSRSDLAIFPMRPMFFPVGIAMTTWVQINPDQSESCFNGANDDCDDSTAGLL